MKLASENKIYDGSLPSNLFKKKLEPQLLELAEITRNGYQETDAIGVLGGQSGVALFQFYCAQYFDDDAYSDTGVEIISHIMDRINDGYSFPSYCNGLAGFGWTLQHLVDEEFVDLDLNELLSHFDDYLSSQMDYELNEKNYDMLHGAMGYGMYFLKRFKSKVTHPDKKDFYKKALLRLVNYLERNAIKDGDGLKWESTLDIEKGNKGFNLSLSHGMSSIVYLLTKMSDNDIEKDRIAPLVKGAIMYFKSHYKQSSEGFSLFPSWIDPNQSVTYNSRLAWCYGDIGIAKAFQWSGETLKEEAFMNQANVVLNATRKRMDQENTLVVDAGFCHGSFGNAHMFHQFGLKSKQEDYEKAALFWLKDGLARYTGDKEGPYKRWNAIAKAWELECNLLEGLSGIGLAIMSLLSNEESTWDECLMLR
ncbi:MAG: lanthionine synthetase C family protein [Bacteroidota bacterium]